MSPAVAVPARTVVRMSAASPSSTPSWNQERSWWPMIGTFLAHCWRFVVNCWRFLLPAYVYSIIAGVCWVQKPVITWIPFALTMVCALTEAYRTFVLNLHPMHPMPRSDLNITMLPDHPLDSDDVWLIACTHPDPFARTQPDPSASTQPDPFDSTQPDPFAGSQLDPFATQLDLFL
jgi:hypothetical protein